MDLDNLIARLSEVDSKPISIPEQDLKKDKRAKKSGKIEGDEVDNIACRNTLAPKIHEMQGKLDEAIETYRKLKNQKKEKSDYFEEQIRRLEKKNEEENTDEDE
ncbi:MAG: hypothetical protein U5K69_19835 [Balneolaceae bacterium]|nr:hypothetical protein [Balneolaceae bacterium]